jgi:hypothetical protein
VRLVWWLASHRAQAAGPSADARLVVFRVSTAPVEGSMASDVEIHLNKLTGKTYISPRVETSDGALRIASKVVDSEGLHYAKVKNEVVLKRSPTGRTEIVAKYLEDSKQLTVVTIQAFNGNNNNPQLRHFSFIGAEIPRLLTFFRNIAEVEFTSTEKINIADGQLKKLLLSQEQASQLVSDNQEVFAEAAKAELTREDVVALGYRKKQLGVFGKLLGEPGFLESAMERRGISSIEALWQAFFEKNQWVFGYGLSYLYVTGFENKKLEQIVRGHDLFHRGKEADGFMKTRGIINAICFVEIKRNDTRLLNKTPY